MYSALVLDERSHNKLIQVFADVIPEGWEVFAHHMTISMGPLSGPLSKLKGIEAQARVTHFACDDRVCAVKVETNVPSKNSIKHITVAVNRIGGGKPVHSNELSNWQPVQSEFDVVGIVKEV